MASTLKLDTIQNPSGTKALDVTKLSTGGYYTRQMYTQVDTTGYNFSTSFSAGPVFANVTGFKAGSLVRMSYHMPCRNDSGSWGGGYIEPQVSFNNGTTWNSLGSSGYDAGVMTLATGDIGSYFNMMFLDPGMTSDFSVQFRFYLRSYDGTLTLNSSHEINLISGTATLLPGTAGVQHYAKIIVEELATLK